MTWLVAVDPGIDATGVATFNLGTHPFVLGDGWRPGETFDEVLRRLGPTTVLRTSPAVPLVLRLRALTIGFATFCELPDAIAVILLEQPAAAGAYHARQGRQRTKGLINGAALAKLHLALGALIHAASCHSELATDGRVALVPAPRLAKALRQVMVLRALRAQRHRPPTVLRVLGVASWATAVEQLASALGVRPCFYSHRPPTNGRPAGDAGMAGDVSGPFARESMDQGALGLDGLETSPASPASPAPPAPWAVLDRARAQRRRP